MSNAWWQNNKRLSLTNQGFQRVLEFYLLCCPVSFPAKKVRQKDGTYRTIPAKPVSQRAITFEQRHITGSRLTTFYTAMKKEVEIFFSADIAQQYNSMKDKNREFIIAVENSEIGRTRTIFYAIRNALAHGSFSISACKDDRLFRFHAQKDEKEKARICLKESTLLRWAKTIEENTLATTASKE